MMQTSSAAGALSTKKPKKVREKKEYTPFPPAPTASKVDKEIESGEYFMKEHERKAMKKVKKHEEKAQMLQKRKADKMAEYVAPSEKEINKKRKKQGTEAREINKLATSVEALKQKFLSQKSTKATMDSKAVSSVSDYLAGSAKKNLKKAIV
ncbi:ribosomal rna assembly protein mis3 [Plasmopara halstedii]|uniref:Ribosomal rna assembly protein mis3 n=1 Tax=Plasmopara halstedii TaxID=4781 RepID=A0A0P1B618_PLAHL|nr:ribosomal rna assembly protein mis3 [Plasmopara halstedii]CEG49287.1 ribosomal rna assembly protein mis3 [Plasmopara halstedii]|eukprot:XP_024585656.1 ribosomal rna assembly protein mis3 [Plasmopara halstedii]